MPTNANATSGADIFVAPDAQDWTINGLGGNDTLTGNAGNDTIDGGAASDILSGGAGNDNFLIGTNSGFDTFNGGIGLDTITATVDGAVIGITSITGIEQIDGGNFGTAVIRLAPTGGTFDFSKITLTDILEIQGGAGADRITGTAGDDFISGGGGLDILNGGAGDDTFIVRTANGFTRFNGGSGFNSIFAESNPVTGAPTVIRIQSITNIQSISGDGATTISGAGDSDLLDFTNVELDGIASIEGGAGDDTIIGSVADDFINGGAGNDRLLGGAGFDTIDGGSGNNVLNGGADDDIFLVGTKTSLNTYIGGAGTLDTIQANGSGAVILLTTGSLSGIEFITGGDFAGDATIAGTAGVDVLDFRRVVVGEGEFLAIEGRDGNDTIYGTNLNNDFGTSGADYIIGGKGDDEIFGGSGDDIIEGGDDFDYLDGDTGFDTINGNLGDDTIVASGGDFLFGDEGNDTFLARGGAANNFDGGDDFDTILAVANGNIAIESLTGVELIDGAGLTNVNLTGLTDGGFLDFTDVELVGIKSIFGSANSDDFTGSAGDDTLLGNGGDDVLNGADGADLITGGSGIDTLTGGAGIDIFKDTRAGLTGDTITDFSVGDRIHFSNLNAATATIAFDQTTGFLSIDADGAGAQAAFTVTLEGTFDPAGFTLTANGTGAFVDYFLVV